VNTEYRCPKYHADVYTLLHGIQRLSLLMIEGWGHPWGLSRMQEKPASVRL